MKKIRNFLYHKASIKTILITAALLAAVAGTNFIIYFLRFLPLTDGTAYMELNIGYLPADLFAFAERYGAAGRRLYIILSCTLDLLTPFLASLLFAWIIMLLTKKVGLQRCCTAGFGLCICACLSDWAENVCMITVLASYPARIMAAAVLARIFTALKYVVMIMLIVSIAYLFMKYRKLTGH